MRRPPLAAQAVQELPEADAREEDEGDVSMRLFTEISNLFLARDVPCPFPAPSFVAGQNPGHTPEFVIAIIIRVWRCASP